MKRQIKKLFAGVLSGVMVYSGIIALAQSNKVGDVIGYTMRTDIVASINGYDIPSYNVGGYTYIIAEDLKNYGFSVSYDDWRRELNINRIDSCTKISPTYVKPRVLKAEVGIKEHDILFTDIETNLDGWYINGFNIGGRTVILFDELWLYGDINYDENTRRISLIIPEMEFNVADTQELYVLDKMSDEERREVNLFLSNFSEAYYTHGSKDYITSLDEEKISFAHTHAFINYTGKAFYTDDGKYMGISATEVDKILIRFFGKTVPHKTPENSKEWFYRDGNFLMRAAFGESNSYFTIADGVYLNSDGTYTVEFTVYYDSETGCCSQIEDKSVYSLTAQEVKNHDHYTYCEQGRATISPKIYNGENTYELVDYYLINE